MQQDPLLDQIAKIKKQDAEAEYNRRKAESETVNTKVQETVSWFQRLFYVLFGAIGWIWRTTVEPILTIVAKVVSKLGKFMHGMWKKYAFNNDEFGNPKFKPYRAGIFVTTMILCWFAAFIVIDLTYYTSLYLLTHKTNEVIYMTNSQEVNSDDDIFSAQGCETLPCDQESATYFRIEPTLFNHVYNLVTDGSMFYSDYVAAAVPPTITKCVITSYGFRFKFLMRWNNIYPYLLDASCSPVFEQK